MKKLLLISVFAFNYLTISAQTKNYKWAVQAGGSIQHYNGNLGNSFFKFKTVSFAGVVANAGRYLNRSFDLNLGASIGNFGYCQTDEDMARMSLVANTCPGCIAKFGMGDLRARMVSANFAIKFKFSNGYIFNEDSKFSPYLYLGAGVNRLSDVMQKQCVNVGYHFTLNAGTGLKYNLNDRISFSYNVAVGRFMTKKVYATTERDSLDTELAAKLENRNDMYLQNSITIGFNF